MAKKLMKFTNSGQFKKGVVSKHKGKKYPEWSGVNHPMFGKHHTEESKLKISNSRKGKTTKEKHPMWISDRSLLVKNEKKHLDGRYREWMISVKMRDSWKCKINNSDCNGRLESHHILNWADYPELRYEINNGITLCHAHHPRKREDEAKLSPFFQSLVAEMN